MSGMYRTLPPASAPCTAPTRAKVGDCNIRTRTLSIWLTAKPRPPPVCSTSRTACLTGRRPPGSSSYGYCPAATAKPGPILVVFTIVATRLESWKRTQSSLGASNNCAFKHALSNGLQERQIPIAPKLRRHLLCWRPRVLQVFAGNRPSKPDQHGARTTGFWMAAVILTVDVPRIRCYCA